MISRLHGILLEKHPPAVLVDVQGVGYEVLTPMSTFFHLPESGQAVTLHTHFVVREDAQLLFGFLNKRDRELFQTLVKVNGVGPKLALAILSGLSVDELVGCVQSDEVSVLVKIPGVGKKTAERLLVELRDRLKDWEVSGTASVAATGTAGGSTSVAEAESALVSLGYKPTEASKLVNAVVDEAQDSEELIRLALKNAIKV